MGAARVAGDAHGRAPRAAAPALAPARRDAVAAHSEVARDPWRRYQATVAFVGDVTYGDRASRAAAIDRVDGVHRTVRGVTDTGAAYSANDPALLAYVHATLVDSALRAAAVYGPRLSPAERDRYVAEMARVARAARARRSAARRGRRGGAVIIDDRRPRRRAAPDAISRGCSRCRRCPLWMRPAYGVLFASAVDLLPRECAVDLGAAPRVEPGAPRRARRRPPRCSPTTSLAVGWRPTRHALRRVARRNFCPNATEPA